MAGNNTGSAELVLGIDASRSRSGGGRAHLLGILSEGEPLRHGIVEVHVWAYQSLLEELPSRRWLIKHQAGHENDSVMHQLWWQRFRFIKELRKAGCLILLNTDAGTVGTFQPAVTMSRDMLSYEPGEIRRFGLSKARLRLIALRYVQNQSLRRAAGAIFLTRYARRVIEQSCGFLPHVAHIPHGLAVSFKEVPSLKEWPVGDQPIECLYVSPVWEFKHQWVVVSGVAALRNLGHNLKLTLIGGGTGAIQSRLNREIAECDPNGEFVSQLDFVPQSELPGHLAKANLFVFASSCENMPNTLLEAMGAGLPIASSERGPMPEILEDGGVYFDPEDASSIARAIQQIITDGALRARIARRAKALAGQYSWQRCADETFAFISKTYKLCRNTKP